MDRKGFTIMEMMVVTLLVGIIFSAMLSVMIHSDTYWKKGQNKTYEFQTARRIMDSLVQSMRSSNPDWDVNGTSYPASISENYTRMDFYVPVYADDDSVESLQKITYKLNPADEHELWVKKGTDDYEIVSGEVEDIYFGGSCNCTAGDLMDCNTVNGSCPSVRIRLQTKKDNFFNLTTDVTMRNRVNITLANSTGVAEPEEGEF
jgi:prepilin-type N-terminal cleavage/methylation domain-containing protein